MQSWIEGASPARRCCRAAGWAKVPSNARLSAHRAPLRIHVGRGAKVARGARVRHSREDSIGGGAAQLNVLAAAARGKGARGLVARVQHPAGHKGAERCGHRVPNHAKVVDGTSDLRLAGKVECTTLGDAKRHVGVEDEAQVDEMELAAELDDPNRVRDVDARLAPAALEDEVTPGW